MMKPLIRRLAASACIASAGLFLATSALADHEPLSYTYQGARSRPNVVTFQPAPAPRPLGTGRLGSDPVIAKKLDDLLQGLLATGVAGLAMQDDQILYEKHRQGPDGNIYPAWSMTKSLVSLTVGHALCDGHIKSLDDLAQQYVPEARGTVWGRATVRQLLQMRSGTPRQGLGTVGDYLYAGTSAGLDMVHGVFTVREALQRFTGLPDAAAPGARYAYANMDTDTLGLVVADATGQPLADYFAATVLAAARLEHVSVFHTDRAGHPVTHGYFFASLRDFARLGRYVIDVYQGKAGTSCLRDYLVQALTPATESTNAVNKSPIGYGYQFWLDTGFGRSAQESVRMSGHQGQDIFMNLRTGKVVVVLGWRAAVRNKSWHPEGVVDWLVQ